MEFAWVQFDGDEPVYIDEGPSGRTNENLRVEAGTHRFAVGDAQSSACPPTQRVTIESGSTTGVTPRIIPFPQPSEDGE